MREGGRGGRREEWRSEGKGRGCWREEQNARGCDVCLQTLREAFPARSEFRCVRAENTSSRIAARLPPRAKLPIKALVCRLFVTPPPLVLFPFRSLCIFLSPPLRQVSEGLQADASLLDDSDLEARLNRWNLGVSLRAAPRALEVHIGATSC